jgi:hypothetical protein
MKLGSRQLRIRHRYAYLRCRDGSYYGCALGAILTGLLGDPSLALARYLACESIYDAIVAAMDDKVCLPELLVTLDEIENRFEGIGRRSYWSVRKLTNWLERQGL